MSQITKLDVNESLAGIMGSLRADSYDLVVIEVVDSTIHLRIDALDGACEECLSPKSIMVNIVCGALGGRYSPSQVQIIYPPSKDANQNVEHS